MSQTSGYFDISASFIGHAFPKDSDHAFVTGSINSVRTQQRKIYDNETVGKTSISSSVDGRMALQPVDVDPTLFSWTQTGIGKKHGFVIPALSSSDHEVSQLNAFTSGVFALEKSAVPASASAYYSKSARFVHKMYKLSASAGLPMTPVTQDNSPSSVEFALSRSFFDVVSGSFLSCDSYNPAIFEIDIPDYGKIRDIKVWVEFIHDIRLGTGSLAGTWGGTGDPLPYKKGGLQNVQISLCSPNVNFKYAHPLWNDPKTFGFTFRPDVNLSASYQQVPELLRNSYLLWAGHAVDDELGLSIGALTSSVSNPAYVEFDTDIDMRTIFCDSSNVRNPRDISLMFQNATDFSPGNPGAPVVLPGLGSASLLNLSSQSPSQNFIEQINAEDPAWKQKNQGLPSQANVQKIYYDMNRRDTFYASTNPGLYKTIDGGIDWDNINDSNLSSSATISCLKIDPINSNILYASIQTAGFGGTLFRSTDAGHSWTPINDSVLSSSIGIVNIEVDQGNTNILFVTTGGPYPLYRTFNAKAASPTFTPLFDSVLSASYSGRDLALLTASSTSKLIVTVNIGLGERILYSNNPGAAVPTWTQSSFTSSNFARNLVTDSFANIVYIAGAGAQLYGSADGAVTWHSLRSGSAPGSITISDFLVIDPFHGQTGKFFDPVTQLSWHATNIQDAAAGLATANWKPYSTGSGLSSDLGTILAFQVDPYDSGSIFAGVNNRGIYKFSENTGIWIPKGQGLKAQNIGSILIDPLDDQHVLAGTAIAGLFESFNGGDSWSQVQTHDPSLLNSGYSTIKAVPGQFEKFYNVFSSFGGFFQSADSGFTWDSASLGLPVFPDAIAGYVIDPINQKNMYLHTADSQFASAWKIFKSSNSGSTWLPVFISSSDPGSGDTLGSFLAIDPLSPNILYFSTLNFDVSSFSVRKSVDSGLTWNVMTNQSLTGGIGTMTVDPVNHSTVYFADNVSHGYGNPFLYKSLDGGISTALIGSGVFKSDIQSVVIDQVNSSNVYVLTVTSGVFFSRDEGNSWGSHKTNFFPNIFSTAGSTLSLDEADFFTLYVSGKGVNKLTRGGNFYVGLASSPTGSNIPWMLDDRIPPGSLYGGLAGRSYSYTASLDNGNLPPPGWLTGPNNSVSAGEFPTYGLQLGPETIRPVYPILDDVFVQKVYDETQLSSNVQTLPSTHTQMIGFRPGLRGTEVHGKWKLMIGAGSGYSGSSSPFGIITDPRAGIWFRQFRIEVLLDQGTPSHSMLSSQDRRFMKSYYVPQQDGKRRVQILSGSAEWDVGINYVFVEQIPEYGRSIGIVDHTGSSTNFAVFTRLTGALADQMSSTGRSALFAFLSNEFGTPYIPISSGSSVSPAFTFFDPNSDSENQVSAKRSIANLLNPNQARSPAPYLKSALARAGIAKQTRDKLFVELDSLGLQGQATGSI